MKREINHNLTNLRIRGKIINNYFFKLNACIHTHKYASIILTINVSIHHELVKPSMP